MTRENQRGVDPDGGCYANSQRTRAGEPRGPVNNASLRKWAEAGFESGRWFSVVIRDLKGVRV